MSNLIPGEIIPEQGEIELNLGKEVKTVKVSNSGDRPVQIGSHYHFFEANKALIFDRETTPVSYTHLTLPTSHLV